MNTRLNTFGTAGLLAVLAFVLYTSRISEPSRSADEAVLLGQAKVVASGDGGLQLFFRVNDEHWLPPLAVYATALISSVAPSDHAARIGTAAVGAVNVFLMFVLSRRLFPKPRVAVGAALLLIATPAHFVYARAGVDAIYTLPFVLAWLIGVTDVLNGGPRWRAAVATCALGVGVYAQPAGPLTMGFLLVITLAAIWLSGRRDAGSFAVPVVAFLGPVAVAVVWLAAHPSAYPDTFGRWVIHAAHLRFPLDGLRAFVNWNTLGTRLSLYWGFLDPSWLFFDGAAGSTGALHGAAPFLFAVLALLVSGISGRLRTGPAAVTLVLLAGLAVAPLAASTFGQPHAIGDALAVVPLVVVLAAGGLADWFARDGGGWRLLGWAAVAAMAIDFAGFYVSYWSG